MKKKKLPNSSRPTSLGVSIGEIVRFCLPDIESYELEPPRWPPDVFAVVATILKRSGAYVEVVNKWLPEQERLKWPALTKKLGTEWRASVNSGDDAPSKVGDAWRHILKAGKSRLATIALKSNRRLLKSLMLLLAASDEACEGVGILDFAGNTDDFWFRASNHLLHQWKETPNVSTLCEKVDPSRTVVLPKLHTPSNGITIRSMTHHLALWDEPEVSPRWVYLPWRVTDYGLKLLLLPWPTRTTPIAFQSTSFGHDRPDGDFYGFFSFQMSPDAVNTLRATEHAVKRAEEVVGHVDGIILPELALDPKSYHAIASKYRDRLVISGVRLPPVNPDQLGRNVAWVRLVGQGWEQPKHHRWLIEESQICQYGLGGQLDHRKDWWEAIQLQAGREVTFGQVNDWLTFCVLICEDLARQDPVAKLVRAVGPNLVVSLLLDGPQLKVRWPARYATVLADDPRSSVLTVTSVGLVDMTSSQNPRGSRSIALWKDALSGEAREICLDAGSIGVVLCLGRQLEKEWSADGRDDGGSTGYLTLTGIHQVAARSTDQPRMSKTQSRTKVKQ